MRPLATCLMMLAIVLLVCALQAQSLGLWLWAGLPTAVLLALGWTGYWLQQTPAELHLNAQTIVMRSVWDVLTGKHPPPRQLLGVLRDHDRTHLFCPDVLYTLRDADWPHIAQCLTAFQTQQQPNKATSKA